MCLVYNKCVPDTFKSLSIAKGGCKNKEKSISIVKCELGHDASWRKLERTMKAVNKRERGKWKRGRDREKKGKERKRRINEINRINN